MKRIDFTSLGHLIKHITDGVSNCVFCIVTSDVRFVIDSFGEDYKKFLPHTKMVGASNNTFYIIRDTDDIRRGWLSGGQPNAVFIVESNNTDWNDRMFAMSRVRVPKLEDGAKLFNIHFIGESWGASYMKDSWVMREENEG